MTEKEQQFNQWFDEYANGVKVFEEVDMKQAYLQGQAELEKENANLKDVIEGYKKIVKWCDKCDKLVDLEKENAELKQAKEGKVVEHFEAYGQCRDSRRIAELEAENERLTVSYETLKLHDEEEIGMLKSENAEAKERINTLEYRCENIKDTDTMELVALQSENAELKRELEIIRRCWYDQKNISLDTNCKLHKAKEIIKGLLDLLYEEGYKTGFHNEMKEAEQFLKDSEVEK